MKKLFLTISTFLIVVCNFNVSAADDGKLFPYPEPPEEMVNLYQRCNFFVDKFWEKCDLKGAFSSRAKLNTAFKDWLSFMPYASADTVYQAIERFNNNFKKDGQRAAIVAQMAEGWLYSDTASYQSDELYSKFVDATLANKKISSEVRKHYEAHKLILDNSSVGSTLPNIKLTRPDGSTTTFADDSTEYTLIMVYNPGSLDSRFARVRLSTDMVLNQLNDQNVVRVVTLRNGPADATFAVEATTMPENWLNVASEETSKYFDMRLDPMIYYVDKNHKIIGKQLSVDKILEAFRSMIK